MIKPVIAFIFCLSISSAENIAISGMVKNSWHVPTSLHVADADSDFNVLEKYLVSHGYSWDGKTSENNTGKSIAIKTDWAKSSIAGEVGNDPGSNNRSGLSLLPGGQRSEAGLFLYKGMAGYYWTANDYNTLRAWGLGLGSASKGPSIGNPFKKCGYSMRLLRDAR